MYGINKGSGGNDKLCLQKSIHILDSSTATSTGSGYNIRYAHSIDKIVGYRIAGILLDGISTSVPTAPYYLIFCDLVRGMSTGHKNGIPESIAATIFNTSSTSRISWNFAMSESTPVQVDSFTSINFFVKDSEGIIITSPARIVIVIEFTHDFNKC